MNLDTDRLTDRQKNRLTARQTVRQTMINGDRQCDIVRQKQIS